MGNMEGSNWRIEEGDRWPLLDGQELSAAEGILGEQQFGREGTELNKDAIFDRAVGGTSAAHLHLSEDAPDICDLENMKRWAGYDWPTMSR